MKLNRIASMAAAALCLANPAFAQGAAGANAAKQAAVTKAHESAMTPGEGQKRLEPMVGNFDVKISIWVDPSKPPIESKASAVGVWVLGGRYVQTMLAGSVAGEPFSGIGYAGYDNVGKKYQAAWMDNGSTGMVLYTGAFDAKTNSATMKASVMDPSTGKPSPQEVRMKVGADGSHISELWGHGMGSTMFKMMELQYTRTKK